MRSMPNPAPARPVHVHPLITLTLLVACPAMSGLFLGGIAFVLTRAAGSHSALAAGVIVGGAIFAANAVALCMALARGADDERIVVMPAAEPVAHAQAS